MAETLRLDIPMLLPDVADEADACVARLIAELKARDGVSEAHVVGGDQGAAVLCIHYDPGILPLPRIRELAAATGAKLTERFGHLLWQVEGITGQRRARTVTERLRQAKGVQEAEATASGALRVEFDQTETSVDAIERLMGELGVRRKARAGEATKAPPVDDHAAGDGHDHEGHDEKGHDHGHAHGGIFGGATELIFALTCGGLLAVGFALEKLTRTPGWIPLAAYLGAYAFGGLFTVREAVDSLKVRRFEIDSLMLLAAAGAAALGEWAEGALLLFLFSLGHSLEHYAMGRAKRAIEALAKLAPDTASVRRGETVETVPVDSLAVGDVVIVKPNERLPADGFVVVGTSSVNQAPVTGESVPVDKQPVTDRAAATSRPDAVAAPHRVFAGTINGAGALEVEVTRRAGETTLAKVVQMVAQAEAQKSPTQRLTDRFERIFVPAVLAVVVVLLFAWVVVDEPFRDSFYRAMAVLVAASPCALAIATPSAVLSGVARAARGGVLVKGGGPLENLGSLSAIAFDKTGTLTEGKPRVTDVTPAEGVSEDDLLRTAVAVERLSDHPLAAAIARDGAERLGGVDIPAAADVRAVTGRGVEARIDGDLVHIGRDELFAEAGGAALPDAVRQSADALRAQGRTIMIVRRAERFLGVIGLMDTPRAAARDAVEQLRGLGVKRMIMISGDAQPVASAVAAEVGIDEAIGDLMPEDKVAAIQKIKAEQKIAMVGDGVNDAPAMANATVGIAMGAAGSDVALETADVALMADDLAHLPFAVGLSRQTSRIIRQNLIVSLGVVAVLVPATIFGLGIGPAVAAHEGSTLVVVFNALRLLAYRDKAKRG